MLLQDANHWPSKHEEQLFHCILKGGKKKKEKKKDKAFVILIELKNDINTHTQRERPFCLDNKR